MKYIGVIARKNKDKYTLNEEIIHVIKNNNFNILPIIVDFNNDPNLEFIKVEPLIKMCSGFILQGGTDLFDIDILITKYLHKSNIPTLGICLGMQTMAMAFSGKMSNIKNHHSLEKYVHKVKINKNSKLYSILLKKDEILVNSRHNDYITDTSLNISGTDLNNNIEAIEDKNKSFFIGVQWHPESIMDDENSVLLFKNFFFNIN